MIKLHKKVNAASKKPTVVFPPPEWPKRGVNTADITSAMTQPMMKEIPQPNAWPAQHPGNRDRLKPF